MKIETKRLILREMNEDDFDALYRVLADADIMQRFSGLSTLLFSKEEVSNYLMAEMRLQQMMADIFKIVTEAADVDVGVPGIEG